MSRLILPTFYVPDRRLVPFGARINWSHPLAKGLRFFAVARPNGSFVDLVSGQAGSSATLSSVIYPDKDIGLGVANTATAAFNPMPSINFNNPISALVQARVNGTGNYCDLLANSSYTSETNNQGWGIQKRPSTDGKPGLCIYTFNNNGVSTYAFQSSKNTETLAQGAWQVGYTNDGTTRRIYLNGNIDNSTATGVTMALPSTGRVFLGVLQGWSTFGAIWNRILLPSEYREMWRNPWQIMAPLRPTFVDAGASITWHTSTVKVRTA